MTSPSRPCTMPCWTVGSPFRPWYHIILIAKIWACSTGASTRRSCQEHQVLPVSAYSRDCCRSWSCCIKREPCNILYATLLHKQYHQHHFQIQVTAAGTTPKGCQMLTSRHKGRTRLAREPATKLKASQSNSWPQILVPWAHL